MDAKAFAESWRASYADLRTAIAALDFRLRTYKSRGEGFKKHLWAKHYLQDIQRGIEADQREQADEANQRAERRLGLALKLLQTAPPEGFDPLPVVSALFKDHSRDCPVDGILALLVEWCDERAAHIFPTSPTKGNAWAMQAHLLEQFRKTLPPIHK